MKKELGLHRIERKPFGRSVLRTYYENLKGERITKDAFEILTSGANKRAKKKKERIVIPCDRQQLWFVTKDIDDSNGKELVFIKYAKSVPLDEWGSYPIYDGPFFEKK